MTDTKTLIYDNLDYDWYPFTKLATLFGEEHAYEAVMSLFHEQKLDLSRDNLKLMVRRRKQNDD